jgi:hypothetical protein
MPTILIYPGQLGEPAPLQAVLREAHEEARKARQAEIDARTKARIPLDDSTRWPDVEEAVLAVSLARDARDSVKVADRARRLVALTEGNALEALPAYEPAPELDGIVATMRVVDDATRRLWTAKTQAAWMAIRDAVKHDEVMARREAYDRLEAVYEEVIVGVVAKLDGLQGMRDTVAESMPALRLAGLLVPLHTAARHFLELPPGKALRCGQQPPST